MKIAKKNRKWGAVEEADGREWGKICTNGAAARCGIICDILGDAMRKIILVLAILFLSGCSSTKPEISIDHMIAKRSGSSALTIISPQEKNFPGAAFNAFTNYDYYLDCTEPRCKAGQMHMLQYITLYPSPGRHTLFVKLSDEGVTNTMAVANTDLLSLDFNASADQRQYILHEWILSLGSLVGPLAAQKSKLSVIDESTAEKCLQEVSNTTSIFGDKMAGFGEKGTVYEK